MNSVRQDKVVERSAKPDGRKKSWEAPKVLWTKEIETLGYSCKGGPAPVSNTNCPTSS